MEYIYECYENHLNLLILNSFNILELDKKNKNLFLKNDSKTIEEINNIIKNQRENLKLIPIKNENKLNMLQILVSNICNLNCKYCYANGGSYNNQEDILSKEVAKKVIDDFYSYYDEINIISFFGGEPTTNIETIEFICSYLKNLKHTPKFQIITNGTILNEKVLSVLKKYNISVTISLDGPKEINNNLRVSAVINDTFSIVDKNINSLRKNNITIAGIEITYTNQHIKNGYTPKKLTDYFLKKYNISSTLIAPVFNNKEYELSFSDKKKLLIDKLDNFIDNNFLDAKLFSILKKISYKGISNYFCNAGISRKLINIDGSIYPCQFFINNKNYSQATLTEFEHVENRLLSNLKANECNKCFAKMLCSHCIGGENILHNRINPKSEDFCNEKKNEVINLGKYFLNLYKDKARYKLFYERLNSI